MGSKEKINLLDTIPFHNPAITTGRENDGTIVIALPRFKKKWMQRFLLPKGMSPDIHVRLEEHGSAVWIQIDGRSTVREIIERLADHFNHEENYESRILTYFIRLQKNGLIKLAVSE